MATETMARSAKPAPADLEALFPGRFVSVTSFKHDGSAVATPVWAVSDGTRLLALTEADSAKVRRIRSDPHVLVAPCRPDGRLRRPPVSGHAEVLTTIADLEGVQRLLRERYKVSYRVVMLVRRLGRRLRGDRGIGDGAALAITVD